MILHIICALDTIFNVYNEDAISSRLAFMRRKEKSGRETNSVMSMTVITLAISLLSYSSSSQLSPISLFGVVAQPANPSPLQGTFNDLRNNTEDITIKLRDVKGDKVPNHYIVVLKETNVLSSDFVKSLARLAVDKGAALRHTFDHALGGFAIR